MKWLIAFALLSSIPTADVAAQEVTASALASASSLSSAFAEPQPRPRPHTINDDDVQGTWELGLGYTFVRFQSSLFSASMNGLDATVCYYLLDHLALEGNVANAFSEDGRYLFYGGGVEVSQRKAQTTAFCARPRRRCSHLSARGVWQQRICGSTRGRSGDKVEKPALAADRS